MPDGHIAFVSGRSATITVAVLAPDGSARGSNPHAVTETGATGLYHFTEATMVAGDLCIAADSVYGYIGGGEYKPEAKDIDTIIADIKDKLLECDSYIDKTNAAQWQIVLHKKGDPTTEYARKDLKDVDGVPVTSIDTVIGQGREPV